MKSFYLQSIAGLGAMMKSLTMNGVQMVDSMQLHYYIFFLIEIGFTALMPHAHGCIRLYNLYCGHISEPQVTQLAI